MLLNINKNIGHKNLTGKGWRKICFRHGLHHQHAAHGRVTKHLGAAVRRLENNAMIRVNVISKGQENNFWSHCCDDFSDGTHKLTSRQLIQASSRKVQGMNIREAVCLPNLFNLIDTSPFYGIATCLRNNQPVNFIASRPVAQQSTSTSKRLVIRMNGYY